MRAVKRCAAVSLTIAAVAICGGDLGAQSSFAWVEEMPDGETGCAFDTPYRFFHSGLTDLGDLLIYFQGGGACWEWVSCSGMFDTEVSRSEVSEYRGIFDPSNEANPFRDFAVLFIPYCTGDVHVGDAVGRYGDDPASRPVQHRGFKNAMAALEFASERMTSPRRIVVSGASAGSYGALYYAPEVTRRFPMSDVAVLGDSGVPLLNNYEDVLRGWASDSVLARLRGGSLLDDSELSLVQAHVEAHSGGTVRVAQVTSDQDAIQAAFYLISGSPQGRARTYALLDSVSARIAPFRSHVVGGSDHGLLRTDQFYEYRTDGVLLSDWVRDFIEGRSVDNIRCSECQTSTISRRRR